MLRRTLRASLVVLSLVFSTPAPRANDLTHFESGPVHPVEISPSVTRLFVAHTADHRLVVFQTNADPLHKIAEVMVGLEPVTVRARSENEVWVVNHVSDDISIVDVLGARVVRTLLVGDEPTDVVFAGDRAFVCVSRENKLRVYDLLDLNQPPTDIALAMSQPRSLALSPDHSTVYVCALDSGNHTTLVPADTVQAHGGLPSPNPPMNPELAAAPRVGLIVRHDGVHWLDEIGREWDAYLPYTLLDNDVIAVDAASLAVVASYHGVGTTLFNIAVHPSGALYVTNQEAINQTRFEPNVRGKFVQNRVTVIDPLTGIPSTASSERAHRLRHALGQRRRARAVHVHPNGHRDLEQWPERVRGGDGIAQGGRARRGRKRHAAHRGRRRPGRLGHRRGPESPVRAESVLELAVGGGPVE